MHFTWMVIASKRSFFIVKVSFRIVLYETNNKTTKSEVILWSHWYVGISHKRSQVKMHIKRKSVACEHHPNLLMDKLRADRGLWELMMRTSHRAQ